jgi:hypothetical protein
MLEAAEETCSAVNAIAEMTVATATALIRGDEVGFLEVSAIQSQLAVRARGRRTRPAYPRVCL